MVPDAVTYGALIEACAKCERKDLALRVYHKALREGHTASLHIYAGAIAACRTSKDVDLKSAMEIYADSQRWASRPLYPPSVLLCTAFVDCLDHSSFNARLPHQQPRSSFIAAVLTTSGQWLVHVPPVVGAGSQWGVLELVRRRRIRG